MRVSTSEESEKSLKISHIVNYPCEFSNLKILSFSMIKQDSEPSGMERELQAKKESLKNVFLTSLEKAKEQNKKSAADYMDRLNIKRGVK